MCHQCISSIIVRDVNSLSESFASGYQSGNNVVLSNKTRIPMNKYWGDFQTTEISVMQTLCCMSPLKYSRLWLKSLTEGFMNYSSRECRNRKLKLLFWDTLPKVNRAKETQTVQPKGEVSCILSTNIVQVWSLTVLNRKQCVGGG